MTMKLVVEDSWVAAGANAAEMERRIVERPQQRRSDTDARGRERGEGGDNAPHVNLMAGTERER
eukprot:COSAG03_NODE_24100_length_275_cov_0.295455_1_plen_63_part_10